MQKPSLRPQLPLKAPKSSKSPFPPEWQWMVDEAVPGFVKDRYSPKESWKGKPFAETDVTFFSRGVLELSDLFTEERSHDRPGIPQYFKHPKYRSAYLLYFLPLQAAKFLAIFDLHPGAMRAAMKHGQSTGTLRVADLGAGPGTASLGLLLWLLDWKTKNPSEKLPKIELHWFDLDANTMKDGLAIVDRFKEKFPELAEQVSVKTYAEPWWKCFIRLREDTSLVFLGHVLNESPQAQSDFWQKLESRAKGGGTLVVEPAARSSSQGLSRLRDELLEHQLIAAEPSAIWGPCLHAGRCPLGIGRDWCHFSVPVDIPGKWFKAFSRKLGSERNWLKFSYLWFAAGDFPSEAVSKTMRRVISDPLDKGKKSTTPSVLVCEPERPGRSKLFAGRVARRGDLIEYSAAPAERDERGPWRDDRGPRRDDRSSGGGEKRFPQGEGRFRKKR